MIIKRIHSENFLKYAKLDLDKLPERGVIAVSGRNESGKTSIGESLCFAIFGRTFTLGLQDPKKLIRWGESQCSVGVEFIGRDDKTYHVTRIWIIRVLMVRNLFGVMMTELSRKVLMKLMQKSYRLLDLDMMNSSSPFTLLNES